MNNVSLKDLKKIFKSIEQRVEHLRNQGHRIYPKREEVLKCLEYTALDEINALILGQDPYLAEGQAHGLSFSVNKNIPPPPSLKNIFKEIRDDLGTEMSGSGFLEPWALQGVVLLNRLLTVEEGRPRSHAALGWQEFTDNLISLINTKCNNVVFLLWGNDAKEVIKLIDKSKHLILTAAHPSPLSAQRGFFGCRHFSKTNEYLIKHGKTPIDWRI